MIRTLLKKDLSNCNCTLLTMSLLFLGSVVLVIGQLGIVHGTEFFSKNDNPFDISYAEWVERYWMWWIAVTPEQSEPSNGSCLINRSDSMVMLLNPAIGGEHQLECDISSNEGIMVPSWSGFFENNDKDDEPDNTPVEQLSKLAKEQVNTGAVTSDVKVDGKSVARLDEITDMSNNVLNYKVNVMNNFTEIYTRPFNITIPENTNLPDQAIGTWPAGAQGWFAFIKPLSIGDHKVSYSLSVQGLGEDNVASQITYTLHVK